MWLNMNNNIGCMINLLSSTDPHFQSIIKEGLWGFPIGKRGLNKNRWSLLKPGVEALLYFEHNGIKGVWAIGKIKNVFYNTRPVDYWKQNPTGFPLQITIEFVFPVSHAPNPQNPFKPEWLNNVVPIRRDELLSAFGIRLLRVPKNWWSLIIFGKNKQKGVTYSFEKFLNIYNEFMSRNKVIKLNKGALTHDQVVEILLEIGRLQGKKVEKEVKIEEKRVDVVWKKTLKSVPYIVFEVSIKGNLYEDLVKLKHAYDIWNAIPVLVTTKERLQEVKRWIKGAFHEVSENFRIITIDDIQKLYQKKIDYKTLETRLGLL